jgi:hypothetical protein
MGFGNYSVCQFINDDQSKKLSYSNITIYDIYYYMDVLLNPINNNKDPEILKESSLLIIKDLINDFLEATNYCEDFLGCLDNHKILITHYVGEVGESEVKSVYMIKLYYKREEEFENTSYYDFKLECLTSN